MGDSDGKGMRAGSAGAAGVCAGVADRMCWSCAHTCAAVNPGGQSGCSSLLGTVAMGGCLIAAQAQACVDKVQSVPRDTDLRGQRRRGVFLKSNTAAPPSSSLFAQMQLAQAVFSVRVRSLSGGECLTTSKDT